jgi:hypothetical protein
MRNVGPTPALNVEIYVGFQVWDGLPNVPNYNMTDHFFASDALMTSAESPFLRDIGVPESIMERLKRGGLLYLIGCFIYQDILNNMHVCGFAYKFNLTGECFPVREKSHNYHIYKPADLHKYGFAYLFPGANIK